MKKINAKYITAAIATSGIAIASVATPCFADTQSQVLLTADATTVDFTVDNVVMNADAGETEATVSDVTMSNNLGGAPLYITNIVATDYGDYDIVSHSSSFADFDIDSKKFSLAINKIDNDSVGANPIDLINDYDAHQTLDAEGSVTYSLVGNVSLTSSSITATQVGNLVVTISTTRP